MSLRRSKTELPLAPIERIIKETTNLLVSESASKQLRDVLLDIAEQISLDAAELAVFSKRKTVKDRDIALAYKNMKKNR
ncbi:MAG TPA: histone [candidate division Zixibacteria bacterium]|nr:histone [candidate division Zixibacteria bacterium]